MNTIKNIKHVLLALCIRHCSLSQLLSRSKLNIRHTILAVIIIIACNQVYTQNTHLLNISFGLGHNYAGVGLKTIVGYKNSGLLLSAGFRGFKLAYAIGGQFSIGPWYINGGIIPFVTGRENIYNSNMMTGANINLGQTKKLFLDIGAGYAWGGVIEGLNEEAHGFIWAVGIGYRFVELKE